MGKDKELQSNEMKKLPSRELEFTEWLTEVMLRTDVMDYRYNLKGCGVWKGYGFKLRKNILQIIRDLLDNTEIPHEETLFPLLVPEKQFMKEAEHVKGFEDEVYWVTHGGLTPLDVKLAIRPTSETVIYPMFALWIRSHQDLPLKPYQIVNVFRYEGKNTRPLIRVREITTFKEAHTAHATAEDAEKQILEAIGIYKQFFNALGVSYIINKRPKWDTFPGADYTIAFDTIFPGRHRTLQIGTVHNLGQTFAKTFEIKFETVDGKTDYIYQTCYGISERIIASVLGLHGDNIGLILPPNVAPIQIVIIPILFKDTEETVLKECATLKDTLIKEGFRVTLDDKKIKPGSKFYMWEEKGVPLRIELGPKDLQNNQMMVVRRDNKEKTAVSRANKKKMVEKLNEIMESLFNNLRDRVANSIKESILRTKDLDKALEWIEQDKGIAEIPFCGKNECAAEIEKRTESLRFLGEPLRYQPFIKPTNEDPKFGEMNAREVVDNDLHCVVCSEKTKTYWSIGRAY